MSEYLSNRKRTLNIGLTSYTENNLVLDVIGNVNISGITTLGGVKISSGIVTAYSGVVTYYGDGSKLTDINAFTADIAEYSNISGISTVAYGLTGTPNLNVGVVTATDYYGIFKGTIDPNVTINYATSSGIATYASTAGIATYATFSGIATYANTAGIATVSQGLTGTPNITVGIATASSFVGNLTGTATTATNLSDAANITTGTINSARLSGTYDINVSYANTAGIANYAISSGIATYATTAGIATNIKGGNSGDILYQTSPNNTGFINSSSAASGQVLIWNGTTPSWDNVTAASGAFGGITVKEEGNTVGTAKSIATLDIRSQNLTVVASSGPNGVATITLSDSLVGNGLSFSGISTLGVVTAADYYGTFKGTLDPGVVAGYALTAGISTVSRGLTGTPNINVGIVTATEYYGTFKGTINADVVANSALTAGYALTAGVSTALKNSRTFEITGDVVASPVSFDGTGNVSLAATIQPNSVALGNDTTGDYVQSISGTSNQITVTGGTGEGSTPVISIPTNPTLPGNVTIANDLQVNNNLNVTGNITIGGTSAYIISNDFRVKDADIVLGFTTDSNGNDVSNDTTANHGGIAVASTEGNPLIQIFNPGIGETNPATYKKIMWFKSGSFSGLNTDAWLINYAVGIGSTQFPSGTRLAAGSVQFTENDLAAVRNINASGIITASSFSGNASSASYASTSGISTLSQGLTGTPNINVGIVTAAEYYGVFKGTINSDVVANTANYATSSGIATYATTAGIATYATNAGIATYATSSGIATYASTAGIATSVIGGISSVSQLIVSGISTLGTVQISSGIITATSGIVTYYGDGSQLININSSSIVGVISYAASSGIASLAQGLTGTPNINVGVVTATEYYGVFKGTINDDVVANSALTAGYASTSGIATYAVYAGIATYANTAGISTVSQGLTGNPSVSITNLNASGISTLGTVQISSGIVTATSGVITYYGDGSKLSNIISGVSISTNTTNSNQLIPYVVSTGTTSVLGVGSSNLVFNPNTNTLGIGTTNPTSNLYVVGDGYFTGILTANRIISNVYGEFTGGSISGTNLVGTALSISGISTLGLVQISSGIISATSGVVTYYGDGSNLTGVLVGISSNGTNVGTATTLNFVGAAISSIAISSGVADIVFASNTREVNTYTATLNQTTFSSNYSVGFVDVFLNGSKLSETQYTATDGTTIVLNEGASEEDIVEIVGYKPFLVSNNISGVGIQSGGTNVGTASTINFTGSGISTITVSSNVATINISGTDISSVMMSMIF